MYLKREKYKGDNDVLESWKLSFHTKVSEINEPISEVFGWQIQWPPYPADLMTLSDPETFKVAVTMPVLL